MHVAHAAAGRAGTGSRQRETHGLRFWAHGHAALATGNRRAAPASAKGGHDGPPRVAGKPARTAGQAQRGQHAGHTDTALGPAAAWHRQTRRRRRAAPTSSGGSTAGHWLRGGRVRTAGPRQRAQEGPRRATGCVAGECGRPGRASEPRRVRGGPLAAWQASANGRAAPASSGGSTAGHWLRGGRVGTAGPPQRAQEGPRRATGRAWRASLCERSAKAGLCSFGMRAASAGQISIVATSSTACQARGLVPSTEHAGRARVTPAASSREGEATGSSLLSEAASRCKA
jgi:hypothetical protein